MFEPKNKRLSVMRQAELLSVNRTSLYVVPKKPDPKRHAFDVAIMNRIDEIFTRRPFYGYRRIHSDLTDEGWRINIKKTRRLMPLCVIIVVVDRCRNYPESNKRTENDDGLPEKSQRNGDTDDVAA